MLHMLPDISETAAMQAIHTPCSARPSPRSCLLQIDPILEIQCPRFGLSWPFHVENRKEQPSINPYCTCPGLSDSQVPIMPLWGFDGDRETPFQGC